MNFKKLLLAGCCLLAASISKGQTSQADLFGEPYRPQIHFSPKLHWTNDPNGMVYYKGVYHLFFQHYPAGTVWGPMHWGHATSKDLVHWQEQPIALYPDSLGYIFSGSAVADVNNTSGFGKDGKPPLVAIFTHHDPKGEKEKSDKFQNQSLAYSLDDGKAWTKYEGNPVLRNPGITDFRDPKVMWYEAGKKWIMTLATKDRITFYSSPNLKEWNLESEFGKDLGAHGGVWECPDLFPLSLNGKQYWILIVSINPGGPNGGSATQYFVGDFDGKNFRPRDTTVRWIDYGPDDYAGITWSNTGSRKIFLGWMSNWIYANEVPTEKWRNAMTIPRELSLKKEGQNILVASTPVKELGVITTGKSVSLSKLDIGKGDLSDKTGSLPGQFELKITGKLLKDFSLELSDVNGEKLKIGFDSKVNAYYIDRVNSGQTDFNKEFAARHTAARLTAGKAFDLTLIVDRASVELFADNGLTVMSSIFFSKQPFTKLSATAEESLLVDELRITPLKSIWK
ncbi:glycoside hydrolase family 32 protein [Pedobacter sp. HMF7647]|uniref:Glycoside hydrolase family 32 protein n=1 Tax=Hufsiella arboris TaxID=2695275 RepID=A0A7K1YG71_9SPHI|nr:glycoside hydrolase family 32 protein [Hufsiella arboris]MXV53168.1 glycoside hydrolase family 32 protein [Hufsiella arboris]